MCLLVCAFAWADGGGRTQTQQQLSEKCTLLERQPTDMLEDICSLLQLLICGVFL